MHPRRWTLWSQQPRLIAYCMIIELAAVLFTALGWTRAPTRREYLVLAGLAALGIFQVEIARQAERLRRRATQTPYINMSSVWTFAGVLVLPPVLITALVAVLYAHLAIRSWHGLRQTPAFRTLQNAAVVVVTCLSARAVLAASHFSQLEPASLGEWRVYGPILLAGAVYFLAGALLIVPALNLTSYGLEDLFGGPIENLLELTTLGLGAVNAVLVVSMPVLCIALVPPMLLLQRGMLVKQLELAATTDDKTGMLNTAGWHHFAERALTSAARDPAGSVGLLMIDLDHFKLVNDMHGHLAGDAVLKEVALTISREVRGYDSVGRFGGEEFVVLLPRTSLSDARAVAERIRESISTVSVLASHHGTPHVVAGLTASVGVALYSADPSGSVAPTLERLLHEADTALYQAKNAGRNQVATYSEAA